MTAALIVGGIAVIVIAALATIVYLLVEELANARVDAQEERSELLNRIQRPSYTPTPQKAKTPDTERQRRLEQQMAKVGRVSLVENADGS